MMTNYDVWKTAYPKKWDRPEPDYRQIFEDAVEAVSDEDIDHDLYHLEREDNPKNRLKVAEEIALYRLGWTNIPL
jgi:mRNA-degrading endonuclease RelE of RelBE toxin-antitoxin system